MTSQMKFYQVSMIIIAGGLCGLCSYFKVMYLIPIVCIGVVLVIVSMMLLSAKISRRKGRKRYES